MEIPTILDRDEEILVVPRHLLLADPLAGFSAIGVDRYLRAVRQFGQFRPRREMEGDPSMKQVIPYLIVRHGARLFLFRRTAAGGEPRLHGKYSIGVGGHVDKKDVKGARDVVAESMRRELEEELRIEGPWRARPVGVLNDDTNPVGSVHFGLVHVVEVERPDIAVREADTLSGRLASLEEVLAARGEMETWSQLILDSADPTAL